MSMILVDGSNIKDPSVFEWGLQDVSDKAAGRTEDTIMHKNRIAQKRKLKLSWNNPTLEDASAILQAFNPEYINITYPDALAGKNETRTFYVGDRTAPVRAWASNYKRYTQITFDVIER